MTVSILLRRYRDITKQCWFSGSTHTFTCEQKPCQSGTPDTGTPSNSFATSNTLK
jgi:hypothetical protein